MMRQGGRQTASRYRDPQPKTTINRTPTTSSQKLEHQGASVETASEKPMVPGRRRGPDRALLLFTLGALALIVAGLIAIPLAARRTLALAPATTPDGTV